MSSSLDKFRHQLINQSITLAGQRSSKQRKIFATISSSSSSSGEKKGEKENSEDSVFRKQLSKVAQEHSNSTQEVLHHFGCNAMIETPCEFIKNIGTGDMQKVSGARINCSCPLFSSPSSSSNSNDNSSLVIFGNTDGSISIWNTKDGSWRSQGNLDKFDITAQKLGSMNVRGVSSTNFSNNNNNNSNVLVASTHQNGSLAFWLLDENNVGGGTHHGKKQKSSGQNQTEEDSVQEEEEESAQINNNEPNQLEPVAIVESAHRLLSSNNNSNSSSPPLRRCAFSPTTTSSSSSPILATTGDDGTVRIWSVFADGRNDVECLLCLVNGQDQKLSTSTTASSVTSSSSQQQKQNQNQKQNINAIPSTTPLSQSPMPATQCLSFHPDGAILSVGDASGALTLWDLRDSSRIYSTGSSSALLTASSRPSLSHTGRMNAVLMSQNGYNIFTGGDDGLIYCLDMRKLGGSSSVTTSQQQQFNNNNNYVWRTAAHGDSVTDLCFSSPSNLMNGNFVDSSVLFSCGLDGTVASWDTWTGECLLRFDSSSSSSSSWNQQQQETGAGKTSTFLSTPSYVPSTKYGFTQKLNPIRCLSFVSTTMENNIDADKNNNNNSSSGNLVVAPRDKYWMTYSANSAASVADVSSSSSEMKTISTTSMLNRDATSSKTTTEKEQQQQQNQDDANDKDADYDSDSDDDLLGALNRKK